MTKSRISMDDIAVQDWTFLQNVRCPGLTADIAEIERLKREIPRTARLHLYKTRTLCLWAAFIGGTGTGKSTLFNALCNQSLSATGVERPKTGGPIVFAHRNCLMEGGFPLDEPEPSRQSTEGADFAPVSGTPGRLLILEHGSLDLGGLVLVDTPDLDSVETVNRQSARDLCRIADVVVFVTSEEKYADEIPNAFLARMLEEGKTCFFLLNKAQHPTSESEVRQVLEGHGIRLDRAVLWIIPFVRSPGPEEISRAPRFLDFRDRLLSETRSPRLKEIRDREISNLVRAMERGTAGLAEMLARENESASDWLDRLRTLHERSASELLEGMKNRFASGNRDDLNRKIRSLFTRYDVLAGPRRFIRSLLLTPFRLLGLVGSGRDPSSGEALEKVRQQLDLTPVLRNMERFHVRVLQDLSPPDPSSPLSQALRRPETALDRGEIQQRLWNAHEATETWLKETFHELSRGLPLTKRWGIYTTSALWGVMIVSFEVIVGGGFSVLDAALDSALAPFVTKGAVELFASREIRKIARELARRHQEGILSVLAEQHDRYRRCLQSLMTPDEVLKKLEDACKNISSMTDSCKVKP
ncbi:MAG: 50S ribosome-binding GTPase [Deltaproteobacteria bacterium]|nr:50S ribosome-binding GTPase [Deltaproteobacteria bacterium]